MPAEILVELNNDTVQEFLDDTMTKKTLQPGKLFACKEDTNGYTSDWAACKRFLSTLYTANLYRTCTAILYTANLYDIFNN